jgi:hypothetical protein
MRSRTAAANVLGARRRRRRTLEQKWYLMTKRAMAARTLRRTTGATGELQPLPPAALEQVRQAVVRGPVPASLPTTATKRTTTTQWGPEM